MEYELTEAGPCRKKLLLKFNASDVDAAFDASYKEINGYVKLNGFRKGKAPRKTLENRFGKEAASGARQDLTDKHVADIIKKENLQVLGDATSSNKDAVPSPGQDFSFDVEFDVAPEFELPEYKGLDIVQPSVEVEDAKVDEAVERYRKMFANYEVVEEAAKEGDVLQVDFETKVDGEEIMSMQEQRLRVDGEILFGLPCPDLVAKFTGAKKGDFVVTKVTLPDDHTNPELRGREADVEVTVKYVERGTLPEMNDAFAEGLGMGSLADFRERIKSNLVREAVLESRQKQEDDILEKLLDAVDYEVPQDMVDGETNALIEQQRMRLVRAGAKQGDAMNTQVEKYRPEAAKLARKKVRWGIMSGKIAEKENIQVSNDDMAAQVEALAQSYNTTPAKIIQRIREFDGVGPMVSEILSIKVVQFILDHAKGGRLDPDNAGSEAANADAAQSVATPEGDSCSCGHDHSHDHHGHHHH